MKKLIVFLIILFAAISAFGEVNIEISGSWETMHLSAEITLDFVSAGLRLPAGRTQAETLLSSDYLNLIRPFLMKVQVDSSSTLGDLVDRRELNLQQIDAIALRANTTPPSLQPDMRKISQSHTISLTDAGSALIRHNRPAPVIRTLTPVSAARYTGILIIAAEALPVHGMRSSLLPVPCLFPKIWDSDMNLIYDRSVLEVQGGLSLVRYSSLQSIFQENPSGLTPELIQIVGERPLRIFARGVFGINPTDLIIDRNDALLIILSEENSRLLSQGRIVFILDESVLKHNFQ